MVVIALGIRSLKMSDNKKRRFGLADLRFAVDWQAVLICVSLIVFNFVWRYRSIAPFDIKNFVFESVIGTLLILAFFTLISYAHYRAEIKKEENKKLK